MDQSQKSKTFHLYYKPGIVVGLSLAQELDLLQCSCFFRPICGFCHVFMELVLIKEGTFPICLERGGISPYVLRNAPSLKQFFDYLCLPKYVFLFI